MPSCPSVRHVRVFRRNEYICLQTFFIIRYSHIVLVFPYQTLWQYSDGSFPITGGGASNAGGVGKNRDFRPISGFRIDDWWEKLMIITFGGDPLPDTDTGSFSTSLTIAE